MFRLRVTVIHALGTFTGCLDTGEVPAEELTYENISTLMSKLQGQIGGFTHLSLTKDDGTEVSFPEKVLDESIFVFKIEEVE